MSSHNGVSLVPSCVVLASAPLFSRSSIAGHDGFSALHAALCWAGMESRKPLVGTHADAAGARLAELLLSAPGAAAEALYAGGQPRLTLIRIAQSYRLRQTEAVLRRRRQQGDPQMDVVLVPPGYARSAQRRLE